MTSSLLVVAAGSVLAVLLLIALRACVVLFVRVVSLLTRTAVIAGEAVGIAAAWPFEVAFDQSEKWVAIGTEWRTQRKIWRTEFRTKMPWDEFRRQMMGQRTIERDDYADALSLFGLADSFTRQEMDARFRRVMQGVHPDTGGTEYLAQQVTAARAVIFKRKGWKK
ncbi:MAG: hypothetical protein ACREDM_00195 [Methylocella sp.]